jgi:hypothetical protein
MWMRAIRCATPAKTALFLAAISAVLGTSLNAQPAPILRAHTTEIGGFVGASYGIDQARIMGGGNICYSVIKEIMPFAEVSYFPGIGRTAAVQGIAGGTASFSLPITDFNFGVHLRIPIPKSRVIPYGVVSFGGIHNSAHTEQISIPDTLNPGKFVPFTLNVPSATNYATSFGGGIRLYATERLGFRGEFKAYKPNGGIDMFYRATGGFFFQF